MNLKTFIKSLSKSEKKKLFYLLNEEIREEKKHIKMKKVKVRIEGISPLVVYNIKPGKTRIH